MKYIWKNQFGANWGIIQTTKPIEQYRDNDTFKRIMGVNGKELQNSKFTFKPELHEIFVKITKLYSLFYVD